MAGSLLGKPDPMDVLSNSWYHLRLSVRYPERVATWDAIILTAASPEQAELYEWQLRRAKRMERIAESTITMAVPDPHGARIGSGAATLSAIRALADYLACHKSEVSLDNKEEPYDLSVYNELVKMRILLLHAGGDSKRVPWANPMGKVFLPLPYLAEEDPDGPVPLLFDHILAVSSCVVQAFKDKGGLFIMTGDVLPCFDSSTMALPDDGACVVTVPTTLDIAINHGVIVTSSTGTNVCDTGKKLDMVENLLQKPTLKELMNKRAIRSDGRALLDTGIFAIRGQAWQDIIKLSSSSPALISELLTQKAEMSLYEELAGAWVCARHEWLKTRPLGLDLVNVLGGQKLFTYCAYDLLFLHFGTSSEILDHLGEGHAGRVGRRHSSSIPASAFCDLATSSVILSSNIASGVSVGDESLIYDSTLSSGVQIGSRCVVVGVHVDQGLKAGSDKNEPLFVLPDRHCLWEVPLVGKACRVILCCGLEDNPKSSFQGGATFCGKRWEKLFSELGIQEDDVWNHTLKQQKYLWNAKLFPIVPQGEGLKLAMWLMGFHSNKKDSLHLWRNSQRISLEEMHRSIDYQRLCAESSHHRAKLAAGIAQACISYGLLGRNLSRLCAEILEGENGGTDICKSFLALCPNPQKGTLLNLPHSRAYQAQVDLCRACGQGKDANAIEEKVWAAVAAETAAAVKQEFQDQASEHLNGIASQMCDGNENYVLAHWPLQPKSARIELPVRVDFVGGWSDTPPWSLERIGYVLNMAIHLEGARPIGAEVVLTSRTGILIYDDAGNKLHLDNPRSIAPPFCEKDQFRLVKAALIVTGIVSQYDQNIVPMGLEISTWAKVPRGSGLGTSSILAAAVVKGLLHVIGGDESRENVARLVLVLEQLMGTGGGWQDQIGGLYPGVKCTRSLPGQPLLLNVESLSLSSQLILELQQRMLVVFTGQVRLAHQVLQKVVLRYLQRDACLITSIKRLAKLARIGRESLMIGNLDDLGRIMLEAWRLHQELDPYCSNELVDRLFSYVDPFCCGYKLVGAGGGGFALLLARTTEAADHLKDLLEASTFPVKVYNWSVSSEQFSDHS
uniref:L-fucokinase domain-containing protein n=1 Tax=Araucaria cunninghamii TaxID=56994 RepID=A0A0D6QT87_ARACU